MSAYLDTNVALWLYAGNTERLSTRAANAINSESLAICPIVLMEIKYLHEIGRITIPKPSGKVVGPELAPNSPRTAG